jgi:glycosyltransferase involved in cell wall biosynthesis
MEAAACGCPIVAGNLPALDDLFGETNAGQRVLPNDVEALARAVIAVFERPNEFSRRAASLRAGLVQRLDWDAVARRYKAFLDSLVSR